MWSEMPVYWQNGDAMAALSCTIAKHKQVAHITRKKKTFYSSDVFIHLMFCKVSP